MCTNQKPVCNSLLVFHCNYMLAFYRFRDIMIDWSKISVFFLFMIQACLKPLQGVSPLTYGMKCGLKKQE